MICLWLESILDIVTNVSAIKNWFKHSLGSFKPNCQLTATGHGCARTAEAAVTVLPDYNHDCARATNTHNHNTVRAMSINMLHLTDTGKSVKEIRQYCDPSIGKIYTLIPVKHIYIKVRLYTSNFIRPQCMKRNIIRFVHKFVFTLQIRTL